MKQLFVATATISLFTVFLPTFACGPADKEPVRTGTAAMHTPPDGQEIFRLYCVTCHGADGKLGLNGAKNLGLSKLTRAERISLITKGKGMMTPFGELLSAEEIEAVAAYTLTFK